MPMYSFLDLFLGRRIDTVHFAISFFKSLYGLFLFAHELVHARIAQCVNTQTRCVAREVFMHGHSALGRTWAC